MKDHPSIEIVAKKIPGTGGFAYRVDVRGATWFIGTVHDELSLAEAFRDAGLGAERASIYAHELCAETT